MKVKSCAKKISLMMVVGMVLVGCGRSSQEMNSTRLATISVGQIDPEKLSNFNSVELAWQKEGGDWVSQTVSPNETIEKTLAVGTYSFKMTYSLDSFVVASTEICSLGPQKQVLVAGKNDVSIKVCPTSDPSDGIDGNGAAEDASITIQPEFDENGSNQGENAEASENNIVVLAYQSSRSLTLIESLSRTNDAQVTITAASLKSEVNDLKQYDQASTAACASLETYIENLIDYTDSRDPNSESERNSLEAEIVAVDRLALSMIDLLCTQD